MNKINKKAFTLIELIIAIAVLSLLLIGSVNIFLIGLRSKNRTENSVDVKQVGSNAVKIFERMVRNAKGASCALDNLSIGLTNPDNHTTTFVCNGTASPYTCSGSNPRIASHSGTRTDCLTPNDMIVANCQINCDSSTPSLVRQVNFSFTLSKSSVGSIDYATENFNTVVNLRKY